MQRKSFYQVDRSAWLFNPAQPGPEEEVRQWCLHELLRAYGVDIRRIKTECKVKVGRKYHRADIVIHDAENNPYCVIECKALGDKKLGAAMDQAISYAQAGKWKPQFALSTNGESWLIKRKLGDTWLSVLDLPDLRSSKADKEFVKVSDSFLELYPVTYWLDKVVPAKYAAAYFGAIQHTMNSHNMVFGGTDPDLVFIADIVCRALSKVRKQKEYATDKMRAVYECVRRFATAHGDDMPPFQSADPRQIAGEVEYAISKQIEGLKDTGGMDLQILRLTKAFLSYFSGMHGPFIYKDVDADIQHNLRSYLEMGLAINFNSTLPPIADAEEVRTVHTISGSAWNTHLTNW